MYAEVVPRLCVIERHVPQCPTAGTCPTVSATSADLVTVVLVPGSTSSTPVTYTIVGRDYDGLDVSDKAHAKGYTTTTLLNVDTPTFQREFSTFLKTLQHGDQLSTTVPVDGAIGPHEREHALLTILLVAALHVLTVP